MARRTRHTLSAGAVVPSAVCGLLAIHAALLAWSATRHSPTTDEPAHLAAGISHWMFGRFDLFRVNPPLVRSIAALPVVAAGCETDWRLYHESPSARAEFDLGADFIAANGERSLWLFAVARWACIPFSLAGGLFCFCWARALFNHNGAGLISMSLWCFDPNILGHGQLITADVAATSFGIGAGYLFWRWLKQPSWSRAAAAGTFLGLAQLAKMTWVFLFAVWPIVWLIWMLTDRTGWRTWTQRAGQLALSCALGLYVLNFAYGFDGTLTALKDFTFRSQLLTGSEVSGRPGNRFAESWLGEMLIPVPRDYLIGLDVQKCDFEDFGRPSYLGGEWRKKGWWYYYLYGLGVKTPHGTQALLLLGSLALLCVRRGPTCCHWQDAVALLTPPAVVILLASSQTGLNQHVRYVLPAWGHLLPLAGASMLFRPGSAFPLHRIVVPALLLTCIASSLSVYPHSLSYFNELSGGPENGYKHLLHSNIDAGQDLLLLKHWIERHEDVRPVFLAYDGSYDPRQIGVQYSAPLSTRPCSAASALIKTVPAGWYAISVNLVYGSEWLPPDLSTDPERCPASPATFAYFRGLEPAATAGYSIFIYHIRSETPQQTGDSQATWKDG